MHGLSSFPAFSEASSRPCVLVLSYLHLEDFHQVISEQVLADVTRKQDQSQVQLAKDRKMHVSVHMLMHIQDTRTRTHVHKGCSCTEQALSRYCARKHLLSSKSPLFIILLHDL